MATGMIPFIGGSYEAISKDISSQNCINCYIEKQDGMNTKVQYALLGTPGTEYVTTLPDAENTQCRAKFVSATGDMFMVFGTNLYKIDSSFNSEIISTSIAGSAVGAVSMAESLFYLIIVDGVRMYSYEYASGDFEVVDYPEEAQPKQVAWIGGRMVAINAGVSETKKNQVFYSAAGPDQVTDWTGSDTGNFAAEQSADPIVSMQVSNGYLWLFGPRSYEIHQPTFDSTDPFDLINSTTNSIGCTTELGTVEIADLIFFFGAAETGTQQIFAIEGFNASAISNQAIENQINSFYNQGINMNDVYVDAYSQAGHTFIVFNFISANITWVYDLSTGEWHQRCSYNPNTVQRDRWEYFYVEEFNGRIITSARNGVLLELRTDKYSDYDTEYDENERPLVLEYTGPIYWSQLKKMNIYEMFIDMETGVGTGHAGDQSYEPQIVIHSSKDGGYTWSNSRRLPLGKVGVRTTNVRIRKLGISRNHVLRLVISDPVKRIILGARISKYEYGVIN